VKLKPPSECAVARWVHHPAATRYVTHHIQPQVTGGLSVPANQAVLCDNCHYTVHMLLWHLAQKIDPPAKGTRAQRALAQRGYDACVLAGTVHKIPNEG
jgi:hypothetical protein